ncbi:MAG: FHA domain-containing protein [Anaerolineales bacterium]|nr:FHA domain-containing protein [Anaerolineales bacterium]
MKPVLKYGSRLLPLDADLSTIGRKLDNTIVLSSQSVSRYHAEIVLINGEYFLRDLNSSSGTYLNERRIAYPVALQSGDKITMADIELFFMFEDVEIDDTTRTRTTPLDASDLDQ